MKSKRKSRPKRADRDAVARLEEIYAKLPKLDCQGKCQACCGPIGLTPVEHDRMAERGQPLPMLKELPDQTLFSTPLTCPQLAGNGRCTVYSVRPMVCRLWGIVESMKCPHGCEPEGGFLSERDGHILFRAALEAGGADVPSEEVLVKSLDDPKMRQEMRAMIERGMNNDRRRMIGEKATGPFGKTKSGGEGEAGGA